jgi:glutamate-1-semialdehyde 2,1-aminomutase
MTSLIHGHAHPDVVKAAREQLEKGTVLGSPSEVQTKHAEIMCNRIPYMDQIRYCNSGTEATLFAIRSARAFAKKDLIIKMDGGYHGSHDTVEINIKPDIETKEGLPKAHREEKGIPADLLNDVVIAPFNNLDAVETLLKRYQGKVAAIIMEPMLGSLGMVVPKPNYLKGMRELANKYNVVLIFDEVITFRLGLGGLQSVYKVEPDLTCLAKIIGGGFPVGAFGGKKEIMEMFDPTRPDAMGQSGTFNGNNITMAAGVAALEKYDQQAVNKCNKLGDRLRDGFKQSFIRVGIKGQVTGIGSLAQVHWIEGEIVTAKDSMLGRVSAAEVIKLSHCEMMNRGIFSAPRGMFAISTPMTEKEIDKTIREFEETLKMLKPCVAEFMPGLV